MYFRCERSSVPPAKSVYSPAESDVGTDIIGIVAAAISERLLGPLAMVSSSSAVETLLASAWNSLAGIQ